MKPLVARMAAMLITLAALVATAAPDVRDSESHWIWASSTYQDSGAKVAFRTGLVLDTLPESAELECVADFCGLELNLNGQPVGGLKPYGEAGRWTVASQLRAGTNQVEIVGSAIEGPSALFLRLRVPGKPGQATVMPVNGGWMYSAVEGPAANVWLPAEDRGPVQSALWGDLGREVSISPVDDYEQWKRALGSAADAGLESFDLQPGFKLERLRLAAEGEDSWISMAFDGKGRIIIARERSGLLRLTLPDKAGAQTKVEIINQDIPEIRGILWAYNALYANSNSHNLRPKVGNIGGLYRLRDTTGDDQFDETVLLGETTATGGHGRNDLALGPDGMIYMIGGDSVGLPGDFRDLTPKVAAFLPGDDRSHGHVMRTDKDGKRWELVCKGLRNPFGIDFNSDGDLFTYDADAEHDMGAPWYRPTQVRQLIAGADYHWRQVTGQWPPYYCDHADNPPTTHIVGKGSPTAVKFGTRSEFPQKWRDALFVLDWAYGRIVAVRMESQGAGFTCRTDEFLRGRPANVTDLDFGPDGAMYFVTGGRKTQSALYRVRYVGEPESAPSVKPGLQTRARVEFASRQRDLKRRLDFMGHGNDPPQIPFIVEQLTSADPWVLYAARIALEIRGRDAVLASLGRRPSLQLLLALAQIGEVADMSQVEKQLKGFEFASLSAADRRLMLRVYEIVRLRAGGLATETRARLGRLRSLFPTGDVPTDRDLAALLISLGEPSIVGSAMDLMESADTQEDRFHYLHLLREAKAGWTPELRERYFRALDATSEFRGGAGLEGFLTQIRKDALAYVAEAERARYTKPQSRQDGHLDPQLVGLSARREFVRDWKLADLAGPAGTKATGDPVNGRRMFYAASCVQCHRHGAEGRSIGPDLTDVSRRFNRRDLLTSIVEPSSVIAEKYQSVTVRTTNGEEQTGLIVLEGDYRSPELRLLTNPLDPASIITIAKKDIAEQRVSAVSAMPSGLLSTLTEADITDLLAFLESSN